MARLGALRVTVNGLNHPNYKDKTMQDALCGLLGGLCADPSSGLAALSEDPQSLEVLKQLLSAENTATAGTARSVLEHHHRYIKDFLHNDVFDKKRVTRDYINLDEFDGQSSWDELHVQEYHPKLRPESSKPHVSLARSAAWKRG